MNIERNGCWQKLEESDVNENSNHSVEIGGRATLGKEAIDAQQEIIAPLKIVVTRGFNTDYRGAVS